MAVAERPDVAQEPSMPESAFDATQAHLIYLRSNCSLSKRGLLVLRVACALCLLRRDVLEALGETRWIRRAFAWLCDAFVLHLGCDLHTDEPTDSGDADDGWNADPQRAQCHLILILILVLVRLIHGLRTRLRSRRGNAHGRAGYKVPSFAESVHLHASSEQKTTAAPALAEDRVRCSFAGECSAMRAYLWIVLPEVGGAQPAAAVLVVIQDLLARRRATNSCKNRRCIELCKRSNMRSLEGMHVQPHTGIGHVPSAPAGIRSAHARVARAR